MSERATETTRDVCDLLAAYEMGLLDEADRRRFELHLDGCDPCLDELYEFAPLVTAVTADPGRFRAAAVPVRPSWTVRLSAALGRFLQPRVLAPVAAIAAVAILVLLPVGSRWAGMADVQPLPWTRVPVRAGEDAAGTLFTGGMTSYADGDYDQAAATLLQAADLLRERESDAAAGSPGQASLYAGVSLLLADHPGAAKDPLLAAVDSDLAPVAQGARWYLAQALLLTDRPDSAGTMLTGLTDSPVYGSRARTLLERLHP